MIAAPYPGPPNVASAPERRLGLRLRLLVGCLGAVVTTGLGLAWAVFYEPPADPGRLQLRLAASLAAGLVAGLVLWGWLDGGIVRRLRGLLASLPGDSRNALLGRESFGWGELSDIADRLQAILLLRQRELAFSNERSRLVERQILEVRDAVARWTATERWEGFAASADAPLHPVIQALNQALARASEVRDQNLEAARQVKAEMLESLQEARESAAQAEHTFVEAMSLLTAVRERLRVTGEVRQAAEAPVAEPGSGPAAVHRRWRETASQAIDELLLASGESVEHIGSGLARVQQVAEQIHVLSNRATLIALNAVVAGSRPEGPGAPPAALSAEVKELARDVRAATRRIDGLSDEIGREVEAAAARMRGLRERVAAKLEQAAPAPEGEAPGPSPEAARALERLAEAIQEAVRASEQVVATAERTSRAAQELVHGLEQDNRLMDGLLVRLSPIDPGTRGSA